MRITYPNIDPAYARERLHYDPATGILTWCTVVRASTVKVGQIAGRSRPDGYAEVRILRTLVLAHRLIWLIVHGKWPEAEIDHRNGIRSDNRLCNLRPVDRITNMQNQRRPSLGVRRIGNKFNARITVAGRRVALGSFDSAEAASAAYIEAKRRFHQGCTL